MSRGRRAARARHGAFHYRCDAVRRWCSCCHSRPLDAAIIQNTRAQQTGYVQSESRIGASSQRIWPRGTSQGGPKSSDSTHTGSPALRDMLELVVGACLFRKPASYLCGTCTSAETGPLPKAGGRLSDHAFCWRSMKRIRIGLSTASDMAAAMRLRTAAAMNTYVQLLPLAS